MGLTYKESGVNIQAGNQFVSRIAPIVKSTFSERVITDIGGFGALFSASFPDMREPVLVSGTDGVGTKLAVARMMNKYDTIGIDAVAMCVNDIVVSGARPLFFLDYIACGSLKEEVLVDVVKGLAEGCRMADCSLVGGETAEHPDVMEPGEIDIAGFAVGIVDRSRIINGSRIIPGDLIIGLPSSGIHSNGYSLVRRLFFGIKGYGIDTILPDLSVPLGETLLIPTRIYTRSIMACIESGADIRGIVHITGGGFYENIPRVLPAGTTARINRAAIQTPPIFSIIQREGAIEDREMFTTFNMGIGMMVIVPNNSADSIINTLTKAGEKPMIIGDMIPFEKEKVIIH